VMRRAVPALLCSSLLALAAQAREPLYGVLDNADLLTCEDQHWSGQIQPAEACYRGLLATTFPAAIRAEALWALGDLQGANSVFQQAVNDEPQNALLRVRWGELYMQ